MLLRVTWEKRIALKIKTESKIGHVTVKAYGNEITVPRWLIYLDTPPVNKAEERSMDHYLPNLLQGAREKCSFLDHTLRDSD